MNKLQSVVDPRIGESVELWRSESGVRVALAPKPGFSTAAGYFGIRFGSTDTHFRPPGAGKIAVPDGSAHFLEHKLFEGREEKVFDRFGKIGARFNGGTGFHTTTYYFVSAGRFQEGLDILLDFVQHPLITEERVEKEKGIIEQEVRMYEDDPGFRGTFLLHKALYHVLPIRIAPGGTVEDVRRTTAADLQACFDAFYKPHNLILSLAGDLDLEGVLQRVEGDLDPAADGSPERLWPEEPDTPAAPWLEERFPVSRPHVWIGWRDRNGVGLGLPLLKRRVLSSLVLDLALEFSSRYHADLYERGVVDDTFSSFYGSDAGYGYSACVGLSDEPERMVEEVRGAIARFVADGPQAADFERVKRAKWGAVISSLQTPDAVANSVLHALLDEVEPFATLGVLEEVTLEEVAARAREMFAPERSAVAVLRPGQPAQ